MKYLNVCDNCLIPDVMHDLLEGALQYEVILLLQVMIQNKAFTPEMFNKRLENVELGYNIYYGMQQKTNSHSSYSFKWRSYEPHFQAYLLHEEYTEKFLHVSNLFVEAPVQIRKSQALGHMYFSLFYHLHYVLYSELTF